MPKAPAIYIITSSFVQAAQDAADIASGKIKNAKGVTVEKANAAYEEAAKAAELAVKRAQEAAGETQETGKGIWQKAGFPSPSYIHNLLHLDSTVILGPGFVAIWIWSAASLMNSYQACK